MSVDSRTETIPASGQIRLANANFYFLINSTAAVDQAFSRDGSTETFQQMTVGLVVGRVRKWDYAFISGVAGTVVTFFYGISSIREDFTNVNTQLATISGTVATAENTTVLQTSPAQAAVATANANTITPNALAKRTYVSNLSGNGATLFVQTVAAGANRGIPVQDGQTIPTDWRTPFDVRNDSGLPGLYNIQEVR